jgi:uncharacterized protein (DUF305 family)
MESLQAAKDKELEETRAIIEEQRREIQKMKEMHQREIATQKLLVDEDPQTTRHLTRASR